MADTEDRIRTASQFILQAPPGEINDVLNDVRNIIADDELLQSGILPALREYNMAQFTVADVPGADIQAIVSEAGRVPNTDGDDERFLDPRSKQTFRFDQLTLEASDSQPHEPNAETEVFRVALEAAASSYLSAHYHDGVTTVLAFTSPRQFIIQIVANKYNPNNYWSGRWRSEYNINLNEKKVAGQILVNVHYYEQGNVQLESKHTVALELPPAINEDATSTSKIMALIEKEESSYQNALNDTYHDMGEKTFKGLRRALPLTRQKLDWDKVLGYKLGAELTSQKGGVTNQ